MRYDTDNVGVQTLNVQSPYTAYINLPTPYGLSVIRILAEIGIEDTQIVNGLQDRMSIKTIFRDEKPAAPALNLNIFEDPDYMPGAVNSLEQSVLKLAARFARYNPPEVVADRS